MDLLVLLAYLIFVGSPIVLLAWLIVMAWDRWAS